MKPTPEQSVLMMVDRRECRRDLVKFASRIPVPGSPQSNDERIPLIETQQAEHHKLILREMQKCMETPHGRLMILAPPGSAKSTYAAVVAPAWYLGMQKDRRIILASYGDDLARKHGRRTRQLLKSKEVIEILQCTLQEDSRAADEFGLTNGSEYIACGIMGGVTGNRCFPAGTILQSPVGAIKIEHVYPLCPILSYDHKTDRAVYRFVKRVMRSVRDDIVRVRTRLGREFLCTSDHPVYVVGKGYVKAALLEPSDTILASLQTVRGVHEAGDTPQVRMGEVGAQRDSAGVLLSQMHGAFVSEEVPNLRERDSCQWQGEECAVLLNGLPAEKGTKVPAEAVPCVFDSVSAHIVPDGVLRSELRGSGPQSPDDWKRKLALQDREELCAVVQEHEADHPSAGRQMRDLPIAGRFVDPPLRREPGQQHSGKPRDTLPGVSPKAPQIEEDAISLVEPVRTGSVPVYDIEVEDTHNFFANEVLVHNCHGLIIDDPVKGRESADSEVLRNRTWDAYQDDLMTRLIPGGWVVIINTRWHELDLSGLILPADWAGESGDILCRDGHTWKVVCLQAECETASDPLGRKVGDMLWPEWFDKRHWDQYRLNRRTWSSLYQQRPAPDEGILFRRADMVTYESLPSDLRIVGASDYAVTPDGGDWTEHGVAGISQDGSVYLIDWWRGQVGPEVWIERQIDMIVKHNPIAWFGEKGPIYRSTEGRLRQRMLDRFAKCRMEWLASVTNKEARATSIISTSGMGRLLWPRAAWVGELQRQCLVFPAGSPDDGVDTLSLIGRGSDTLGRKTPRKQEPVMNHFVHDRHVNTGWMAA